jgi:hypothetical protein
MPRMPVHTRLRSKSLRQSGCEGSHFPDDVSLVGPEHIETCARQFDNARRRDGCTQIPFPPQCHGSI